MFRAIDKWLAGYLKSVIRRPRPVPGLKHLFFCVADHYEPFRGCVSREDARRLVQGWTEDYRRSVESIADADGRMPRHTFFYPAEDYDPDVIESLAGLCRSGYGEVEIHLHHRNDTAAGLRKKLELFRDRLSGEHGLLGRDAAGRVRYGFVHGNWALCNSRPDGDWCGVNEELGVLNETGCYADFTFPSAPSPTQPRLVNAIYRAWDRPGRPRGADAGAPVEASRGPRSEDGPLAPRRDRSLMIIQGPLALDWSRRKWGVLPRVENAEISGANPPSACRGRLWARQWIHVSGRPEWVFVKVHTHGCVAASRAMILGASMRQAHEALRREFNDGNEWRLHYVTAREMYNVVRSAETGVEGAPDRLFSSEIQPPAVAAGRKTGQAAPATW